VTKVNVDLGSRIQRGEALTELWIPEMQQERAQKQSLVEEAEAAIGQAEAAVTATEAAVAEAAAKVKESQAVIKQYEAEVELRDSEHKRVSELVQKGAIEAALQDEKLKQLKSAEAALAAADAGIASAAANEQVKRAYREQARANLTLAQARLKVAQADLKQVEILIDYAIIRAPYDGVVTERRVNTGDFAQSAADGKWEPLFSVMRTEPLRIVADIPESDAAWMRPGLRASLTVDGIPDRVFAGVIKRQSDRLDPQTRTLRVEVEIDDATDSIRCGMYGALEITEVQPAPSLN
jgi:multidrug resistance efflux pump